MLKRSLLPLLGAVAFVALPVAAAAQAFPDGPGKEILEKKCSTCHAPEQVTTFGRSAEEWHEVVINMIDLGAEVNEEEAKVLVEYLTKNWPLKGATPPAEKPSEPPAEKPSEPPADKPSEPPADKPAEKPATPQAAPGAVVPVPSHIPAAPVR
jgi:mono/diheme cytochrome c family protein